ncbi:endonuclease domain-containing protein [Novosphingobium soli]|uniref:Endonuclease domain-containing protein n=1 Tax=Novosphingobium soli TaxID=574956 RepID=A0ABV6D0I3_9SPHN
MTPGSPRNGEGDRPEDGGGGPPLLQQPIKQVKHARALRKKLSLPEGLLWRELQTRPGGYRFRKQFPQAPYTIDFACLSARLAIEVDGEAHNRGDRPAKDIVRDTIMAERGFRTLRLPAYEVLKNMDSCITAIVEACREAGPPPPSLRDGPPPRSGEELA